MRILVADDHKLLTDMLALHSGKLAPEMAIKTVQNISAVLDCKSEPRFDLIILDLHMPGMHGLSGFSAVRKAFPDVPIALMSGEVTDENFERARAVGAVGFIPKTIGLNVMLNGILKMASGTTLFDWDIDLDAWEKLRPPPPSGLSQALETLTRRERDVLRVLCSGASNIEIAKALSLEPVTVGLYLRTIYRKLDVSSRTQAVKLCLESGLDI